MNGSIRCDESMVVPRFTNDESVWVRTLRSRGRPSASKLLASDTVRVSPAGSATPAMPACRLINEPAASTPAAARPAAAEPAAAVPVHDNAAARLAGTGPAAAEAGGTAASSLRALRGIAVGGISVGGLACLPSRMRYCFCRC